MKCTIVSYVVSDGPPYLVGGAGHAETQCTAHNWHIGRMPIGPDYVCPLGRIEAATDKALADIAAAKAAP